MQILGWLLLWVLPLLYLVLILRLRQDWFSVPEINRLPPIEKPFLITVVVAARDEAENMPVLLKSLAAQDYPAQYVEIIVVDDHSTDDTAHIVQSFPLANIRLISLKDHLQNKETKAFKKEAIAAAIESSRGDWVVSTDADCITPSTWLSSIAAYVEKNKPVMLVMPVSMRNRGTLISQFDRIDFMTLQGITAAAVGMQRFGMCNGANLAYSKKAFDQVDGFNGIDQLASGDDMLLLQKMEKAFPSKIHYLKSKAVLVTTESASSLKGFLQQRARWSGKAGHYPDKNIMPVLWLVWLFNCQLLLMPLLCWLSAEPFAYLGYWLLMLLIKTTVEWTFLSPVTTFFGRNQEGRYFPFFQIPHVLYTVGVAILGKTKHYQWKGRVVNPPK